MRPEFYRRLKCFVMYAQFMDRVIRTVKMASRRPEKIARLCCSGCLVGRHGPGYSFYFSQGFLYFVIFTYWNN